MKKLLLPVLCLCMFLSFSASAEETDGNSVLLKVRNCSDLKISYLRFDIYRGDVLAGIVVSCPNEGEDFYRCPYTPESQEELDDLRIEYSYGISDLSPEEAVMQVMAGNPAEEHSLPGPELGMQCGETYSIILVRDQDGYQLKRTAGERNDRGEAAAPRESDPEDQKTVLLDRLTEFLLHWSRDEYDDMLEMCTPEWKAGTEDTILIVPEGMKEKAEKETGSQFEIHTVIPGSSYEIGSLKFETVPAYNKLKPFHPKHAGWVGYILEVDGQRIYIAGDTDAVKEVKQVQCDVALVPVGGTYTMDAIQAAELVNAIRPKTAIPTHYGSIVGKKEDAAAFAEHVDDAITVEIRELY